MSATIAVEVVFALPGHQELVQVAIEGGATVADAIAQSDLARKFPEVRFDKLQTGIWGRVVPREHVLNDGDRVEIYRPLERDPRDARRILAALQSRGSSS